MIFPHLGGSCAVPDGSAGKWGYERFPACSENISAAPEAYFKRFYYGTVCRNVPAPPHGPLDVWIGHIMFGTDDPLAGRHRVAAARY